MENFFADVAAIIEQARSYVGRTADLTMCVTYFEIGRIIVEQEQDGKARAEYGRGLLKELSEYLTAKYGRGFSLTNLKNAKKFFLIYAPSIKKALPPILEKGQLLTDLFRVSQKSQSLTDLFNRENISSIRQSLISESYPFKLSWTHYNVCALFRSICQSRV